MTCTLSLARMAAICLSLKFPPPPTHTHTRTHAPSRLVCGAVDYGIRDSVFIMDHALVHIVLLCPAAEIMLIIIPHFAFKLYFYCFVGEMQSTSQFLPLALMFDLEKTLIFSNCCCLVLIRPASYISSIQWTEALVLLTQHS